MSVLASPNGGPTKAVTPGVGLTAMGPGESRWSAIGRLPPRIWVRSAAYAIAPPNHDVAHCLMSVKCRATYLLRNWPAAGSFRHADVSPVPANTGGHPEAGDDRLSRPLVLLNVMQGYVLTEVLGSKISSSSKPQAAVVAE